MLSLLAIPIVGEATQATSRATSYFSQPIDAILFDILVWFGWIPIIWVIIWGLVEVWLNYKRGEYSSHLKFVLLGIDVPAITEQTPKALENLFATLYSAKSTITWKEKWIYGKLHPVFSFEIISTQGYISFLIRTQTRFRDVVEAGIYAHYPEAEIAEVEDYAQEIPSEFPNDTHEMWGAELILDNHFMHPIRTYIDFEDRMTQEIKDPLGYTLEQLAKMKPGEHFWIQILIQPSSNDWQKEGVKRAKEIWGGAPPAKKSMITSAAESALSWPSGLLAELAGVDLSGLLFGEGGAAEEDQWKAFKITLPEKEEAERVLLKSSKVGFGAKIRILYSAKKNAFVKVERTAMVKGILNQYAHLNSNKFTLYLPQVPKDDYFWMRWSYTKRQRTLMKGYKNRSWGIGATPMWLNAEELATLWHFPAIGIKAPLVRKAEAKRAEPPVGLPITDLENTLPGYDPISLGRMDRDFPAGLPGAMAVSDAPTSPPPIGLPTGLELEEPLYEAMPHPLAPTGIEREGEVLETQTIRDSESSPVSEEPDPYLEPEVLPQVTAPTQAPEPDQESPRGVPPNLPI
ncbi:hypothetical protein CO174_00065 [Candidatus Uhrbacteria bacterium CG_4_9_14_3_um_filter_50_9]|uniref:DUF8128 domain-containing protein n=1 Tax=Candidatus Uhrbacteria bacterium CG_4_9_14_3_um_filter_50_9 TaxID=1975035 RepID=A0A2M7XF82_9BACT|nr:MAG: hypothetical protein CO174_00065 [Candidatus Uhrbacteria bacterium CG_4_9_14_3_um_filter_50_9]